VFSTIEELTVNYTEDDILVVKELDKRVLSKGAWTTIIFRYQQWNKKKEEYGPDRYTIRRYRKMNDVYKQQGKFNISSADQARKIVDALNSWVAE
tara:strand:- start:6763 stop:7047 length:285 start_codon:yes stop_codon:yes gene_type:complete